ncbi:hypothetical protein [Fluviicola sp.]|uniref:hypothetical protein n=1 Tax=Fluviicola sp. TaxID=1917219 RepID=UPI0031D18A0B
MTWIALTPDEQETIFQSESTTEKQIAGDLKTVVDRMIENKEKDLAASAQQLLFLINATNGFIKIVWWNNEDSEVVGEWVYEVQLSTYWETEDDAFNFDKTCRFALFDFTEDHMILEDGTNIYDIFMKTELSDIEEVLI